MERRIGLSVPDSLLPDETRTAEDEAPDPDDPTPGTGPTARPEIRFHTQLRGTQSRAAQEMLGRGATAPLTGGRLPRRRAHAHCGRAVAVGGR
jgi:hypothetical protein